jgi:hypothetical protein
MGESRELRISKKDYETIGTHSLIGMAFSARVSMPGPLTIIFEGSSLKYCQEHNGPELVVMADFVPFCIAQSILDMQKMGYEIEVRLDDGA